jgi:hypothetical protein
MYLGSDVDIDQTRREGTDSVEVGSRPGGRGRTGAAREGCVGWRPRYGHSSHGMRMTMPPEWPVSTMRWAFAESAERGRPLRPGVRRWLPAHPAGGGGRRPRPARHRHRSALMRGDGIPWLAARRSGCPGVAPAYSHRQMSMPKQVWPNMATATPLGLPGARRRRSSRPGRSSRTPSHPPPESIFPRARHGRSLPRRGELTFRTPTQHRAPETWKDPDPRRRSSRGSGGSE